jgi:hypothetical protein
MNLRDIEDRLDANDGEPVSFAIAAWSLIGLAVCVIIAVTVMAIRVW